MKEPTISLLLMGKDELYYFLPEVIKSAKEFVDEIIYVDTGSNDGTIEWLSENEPDVKVYYHEWLGWEKSNNIRNFAIKKCTSDYILATDCDEVFGKDKFNIKKLLKKYPKIEAWNLQGEHYMFDLTRMDNHVNTHIWLKRIFKNNGKLFYPEDTQHSLVEKPKSVAGMQGDLIHHYGHCKNTAISVRRYDENTGEKNEWPEDQKQKREDYLKWQLWGMITGTFPIRKIKDITNHPKEILDKFHIPEILIWMENKK